MRAQHFRQSSKRGLTAALLAVGVVAVLTLGTRAEQARKPEVTIRPGQLVGQYLGHNDDVAVFFGVPYAKPPLGNLRFAPPQPLVVLPDSTVSRHQQQHCLRAGDTVRSLHPDSGADRRLPHPQCLGAARAGAGSASGNGMDSRRRRRQRQFQSL